jgi:hypothetical protein
MLVFIVSVIMAAGSAQALLITEAMSNSQHTNTWANGDWWELYNNSGSAVDLSGYSWDDDSAIAGSVVFNAGISLAPGESLIVIEETTSHVETFRAIWGLGAGVQILGQESFTYVAWPGLGAAGDVLYVYDAASNQLATAATGNQSAPNGGRTFTFDTDGNSLGRSANGVYGAWATSETPTFDIGSPGFVYTVPEPATVSLLGFAGLGGLMAYLRRRLLQKRAVRIV